MPILLLSLLKDLRIWLLLALLAVTGAWRIDHRVLTSQKAKLMASLASETERANGYQQTATGLIAHVAEQNAKINALTTAGDDLRRALAAKAIEQAAEREEFQKKLAALPPLPDDAEGMIRAAAKSIKDLVGSGRVQ